MQFNNRLIEIERPVEEVETVAFHTLREGNRYRHTATGPVSKVIRREFEFATIERADGWLITCPKDGYVWDRLVVKVL